MRELSRQNQDLAQPLGSAGSNLSAPLNGSARKEFGFHSNFASSFHSRFQSPSKKIHLSLRHVPQLEESPMMHKQKQLHEFSLNLKQNKISKYGKAEESEKSLMLTKKIRKRIQDSNSSVKKLKKEKTSTDYTPSVFENRKKFPEKKVTSVNHEKPRKEDPPTSFYLKMLRVSK